MSPYLKTFAMLVVFWRSSLAVHCDTSSCIWETDETSLLQVEQLVQPAGHRDEAKKDQEEKPKHHAAKKTNGKKAHKKVKAHGETHSDKAHWSTYSKFMNQVHLEAGKSKGQPYVAIPVQMAVMPQQQQATGQQQQAAPGYNTAPGTQGVAGGAYAGYAGNPNYSPGVPNYGPAVSIAAAGAAAAAGAPDISSNTVTVQSQVSGAGADDPRKITARAAELEEKAERAMQDAVWKAQQQERASNFASSRAAALRMSADRAARAQTGAARAQIHAADAMENDAVRRAAAARNHARMESWKARVQHATAVQATADQLFSAQRAAAATTAHDAAIESLHGMEDDLRANDKFFNNQATDMGTRQRYQDAVDNFQYQREDFRDAAQDEDYDMGGAGGYQSPPLGTQNGQQFAAPQSFYGGGNAAAGGNCASFQCPQGFWQISHGASRRCGASCNEEMCCRRSTHCGGFACGDGFMEIPNGKSIRCGNNYHGPCAVQKCCNVSPVQNCKTGDQVTVTFDGNGQQYPAVISATTDDGAAYFITWANSEETDMAAPSQVFRNGIVCANAEAAMESGAIYDEAQVPGAMPAQVQGAMPAQVLGAA